MLPNALTWHRAADAKSMTYREFLSRHTSRELTEIAARDEIDPLDFPGRIEFAVAKLCSLIWNLKRTGSMDPHGPSDYLPKWGQAVRDDVEIETLPTPAELLSKCFSAFRVAK